MKAAPFVPVVVSLGHDVQLELSVWFLYFPVGQAAQPAPPYPIGHPVVVQTIFDMLVKGM